MRYPKEATYRFFVHKGDKEVNIDELTEEERERVGVMAYQTLVRALGYVPVTSSNETKK